MRFVCFNAQKHASIAQLAQAGEAVAFANVLIKKNRVTKAVEAHIQDNTSVAKSPKKIELPNHVHSKTNVPKQITISQLNDEAPDQLVTVNAKIVEMSETTTLSTGSRAGSRIKKLSPATALALAFSRSGMTSLKQSSCTSVTHFIQSLSKPLAISEVSTRLYGGPVGSFSETSDW